MNLTQQSSTTLSPVSLVCDTLDTETETEEQDILMWHPLMGEHLDDNKVAEYLDLSCTSCLPGGGRNIEYALHVLYKSNGNLNDATIHLLNNCDTTTASQLVWIPTERQFQYVDSTKWTETEIELFERLINEHEKNFFKISQDLQSKSVKQCVEFYYFWKKAANYTNKSGSVDSGYLSCAYETPFASSSSSSQDQSNSNNNNNTTTTNNTKTDQNSNNQLRSLLNTTVVKQEFSPNELPPLYSQPEALQHDELVPVLFQLSNQQIQPPPLKHQPHQSQSQSQSHQPPPPPQQQQQQQFFPCKVCGRVFEKIKSRSAHMKRHKNENRSR